MKAGYTQIIENNVLKILSNAGELVALGEFNIKSGLIEMKPNVALNVRNCEKDLYHWHKLFGHFNKTTVIRNLRLHNIPVVKDSINCEDCLRETKSSQENNIKSRKVIPNARDDRIGFYTLSN